jgi:hypothetical protein
MSSLLNAVGGKVFIHPISREVYGPIRLSAQSQLSTLDGTLLDVLGEDSCGNCFAAAKNGAVQFWDHETDHVVRLADSVTEFVAHCAEPPPVELDPKQVKAVWMDPEFAKSIGKRVPKDGWVKKKGQ